MTLATIPADRSFLDDVARRWLVGPATQDVENALILVPGRRAARNLTEAFLRCLDGKAALLPRIIPVGDVSEDDLAQSGAEAFSFPHAVDKLHRLSVLAALVLRAKGVFSAELTLEQAWPLASALAELMDDAERVGVDLRERLPDAAEPRFADHWHKTLQFLHIVTEAWPEWLRETGLMNPVARQVAVLQAQAARWREVPPQGPVWAVGFTDGMFAVCAILRAVLEAPQGCVILPGVDLELPDALWHTLPESHPQSGFRRLLNDLDVSRETLSLWQDSPLPDGETARKALQERIRLTSLFMRPMEGLAAWGETHETLSLTGITRLDAADQQQEAASIAMILRVAVETSGLTASLVTPDRGLARRVSTELLRYGIVADDSAGESLALTPAAVLLRLLVEAAASDLAPVALLALLKHPLVAMGSTPGNCRATSRRLERLVLRGPAPPPGIAGLRLALERQDQKGAESADTPDQVEQLDLFLDRLSNAVSPLFQVGSRPLPDLLVALVRTAEALATTQDQPGDERLWMGAEGHALSHHIASLITYGAVLPPQSLADIPAFLHATMADHMVFGQRVLQGRDGIALHPRVSILGVLEARLHCADLVVLGGLNEGIWPPATDPGPWLSRPMRTRAGLPSPERLIGTAAHDFTTAFLSGKQIVLSSAARRDGAPAVPARWLVRLEALLEGRAQVVPAHPVLIWQARLDQPSGPACPVPPPEPRPPIALRPRRLSVTEIDSWLRDPYAIYARHVLNLRAIPALEEAADRSDIGVVVHEGLDRWLSQRHKSSRALHGILLDVLKERNLRPALAAWWRPRVLRIADWVCEREAGREMPRMVRTEQKGSLTLALSYAPFRLTARADRIEIGHDGRATIIDYKTGTLPNMSDVEAGWSSQLVLEAAMLRLGGFADLPAVETAALLYWRLTGDRNRGEELSVPRNSENLKSLVDQALDRLGRRIQAFDDPDTAYWSHPHPDYVPRYSDYAHLARVSEWSAAREEGGE